MNRRLAMFLVLMVVGWSGAASAGHNHEGHGLPPGLQKKVERGEPLPPGWQKKLGYRRGDRFDEGLLRYGRLYDIDGHRQRVEIEDRIYTIIKDTREIVDILKQ